jgi:hypothetical protein
MNVKVTAGNDTLDIPYTSNVPGYIKVYRVPEDYSTDGYYVGKWQDNEIEPVPACAGSDMTILLQARCDRDDRSGSISVLSINYAAEGVTAHAAN